MAVEPDIQEPPPLADSPEGGELDLGYQVAIDQFSGPLDLLLYLVKRTEVDIVDIPIATITDQFVATLAAWQAMDLDVAGDFIVMAATLLEIKARQIAPPPEKPEGEGDDQNDFEDVLDPRADLIQKLLEYRRFKDAAVMLLDCEAERSAMAIRQVREAIPEDPANEPEIELTDLDVHQLYRSFEVQIARISGLGPRRVLFDETPIDVRIQRLMDRLQHEKRAALSRFLSEEHSKSAQAGVLVASLEVVRQHFAEVQQLEQYGEVDLRWREPEEREREAVLPPEEPEETGRRKRRIPLLTFHAVEGDSTDETVVDDTEERLETDEQRFLRELDDSCNLSGVLATVADVEGSFIEAWRADHDGHLPPTIAADRAAQIAQREEDARLAAVAEAERQAKQAEREAKAAERAGKKSAQWAERKEMILAARAKREAAEAEAATQAQAAPETKPEEPAAAVAVSDAPVSGEPQPVVDTPTPVADVSEPTVAAATVETETETKPEAEPQPTPEGEAETLATVQVDETTTQAESIAADAVEATPVNDGTTLVTTEVEPASTDDVAQEPAGVESTTIKTVAAEFADSKPAESEPSASEPSASEPSASELSEAAPNLLDPRPGEEVADSATSHETQPTSLAHDADGLSPAAAAILAAAEELFASKDDEEEADDDEEAPAVAAEDDDANSDRPEDANAALLAETRITEIEATEDADRATVATEEIANAADDEVRTLTSDDESEDDLIAADPVVRDLLREDDHDDDEGPVAGDPSLRIDDPQATRATELDVDALRLVHSGAADAGEADDADVPPDHGESAVARAAATTGAVTDLDATDPTLFVGPPEGPVLTGAAVAEDDLDEAAHNDDNEDDEGAVHSDVNETLATIDLAAAEQATTEETTEETTDESAEPFDPAYLDGAAASLSDEDEDEASAIDVGSDESEPEPVAADATASDDVAADAGSSTVPEVVESEAVAEEATATEEIAEIVAETFAGTEAELDAETLIDVPEEAPAEVDHDDLPATDPTAASEAEVPEPVVEDATAVEDVTAAEAERVSPTADAVLAALSVTPQTVAAMTMAADVVDESPATEVSPPRVEPPPDPLPPPENLAPPDALPPPDDHLPDPLPAEDRSEHSAESTTEPLTESDLPVSPSHQRFWLAFAALALLNVLGWAVYSSVVWVPRGLLEVSSPAAITADGEWNFRFNLDAIPETSVGQQPVVPPVLDPPVPGTWRWQDLRTLTFTPRDELPPNYAVIVTLPIEALRTPKGLRLSQDLACVLRAPALQPQTSRVVAFDASGGQTIDVAFDRAVDPSRLQDRVQVTDGAGAVHTAQVVSTARTDTVRVAIPGDSAPSEGAAKVALTVAAPGPQRRDGPLRLDASWRGAVHLGHRLRVTDVAATAPARGDAMIALTINVPDADRALLRDSVSVEPAVAVTISESPEGLHLTGAFEPTQTYTVRVAARHPEGPGADLNSYPAAAEQQIVIPARAPGLWLDGDVERLALSGVNCGTVAISVRDGDDQEVASHIANLTGEANSEVQRDLALRDLLTVLPAGDYTIRAQAEGASAQRQVRVRDVAIDRDRWQAATTRWVIHRLAGESDSQPVLRLASVID